MNSEETLLSCLKQLNDDEILRLQKIVKEVEGSRHQECFILGTYLAQINKLEEALDLLAMAVGGIQETQTIIATWGWLSIN